MVISLGADIISPRPKLCHVGSNSFRGSFFAEIVIDTDFVVALHHNCKLYFPKYTCARSRSQVVIASSQVLLGFETKYKPIQVR